MNYLDTSALVKRFVAETGSERVARLILHDGPVATATIAYAEVFAALARRYREGALSAAAHSGVRRRFEREWQAYVRVALGDGVLHRARDLVRRYPLRGYDAVHLATALDLRETLGEPVTLVAADRGLLAAAQGERLAVINPESSS